MSHPSAVHQTVEHYRKLAAVYDDRWGRYTARTLLKALDALALSGTERLLDVGCGTGELEQLALQRMPGLRILGLDATPAMVVIARKKLAGVAGVSLAVGHAEALPYEAAQFDAVVSSSMLHHVRQPQTMLQECARVLRPGGRIVIADWCGDFWRARALQVWARLVDRVYVRMYRATTLARLLEQAGFTVERAERFVAPPCYGMMCLTAIKAEAS